MGCFAACVYHPNCNETPPPSCRINVFALLGFHLTLSDDLDDLYLAELEEEDEAKNTHDEGLPIKAPL
jgi:hypothetical protein